MRTIIIRDETLRDGLQQPGINISDSNKLKVAHLSAELLDTGNNILNNQIDLGMPEVSTNNFKLIKNITHSLKEFRGVDFFVTGRSTEAAVAAMIDSLAEVEDSRRIIAPFIGISKLHREKLGFSQKDVLRQIKQTINHSLKYTKRIHFPLEGGYYAYLEDKSFVYKIFSILNSLGVEAVPFCDTVGTSLPFNLKDCISFGGAIADLRNKFPKISISSHCHDDLGLAVANTIDGILNGASIIDGTYFGIGERAGNASLQTLLTLIYEKEDNFSFKIQANLNKLYDISEKIKKLLQINVSDNFPIVGKNSFSHASGIHQDGVLKNPKIYQPFEPENIGRKGHKMVLGYMSGKRGINFILQEKFKIKLSENQLDLVVKKFKDSSNSKISPEDNILQIISDFPEY